MIAYSICRLYFRDCSAGYDSEILAVKTLNVRSCSSNLYGNKHQPNHYKCDLLQHFLLLPSVARQHTILDVIRFQSSLDPVFCSELCRVKSRFVSVRKDVVFPGQFRNLQVILENEGCVRTIFCAARPCFCSMITMITTNLQAFVFSGCERFIDANIFGKILVSLALFFSADIHQGDERFGVHSRGKQCMLL